MPVERARHQFLARAALALNQRRGAARRRPRDQVEHGLHAGAAADDVVEAVRPRPQPIAQLAILPHQRATLDGVAQDDEHLVVLEGLGEVVERAALGRGHGALDGPERRDHDHGQFVVQPADLVEHLDAVHVRQHQVEQHGVDAPVGDRVEALAARRRRGHAVALGGEQRLERLPDDLLVVDDQDRCVCLCHVPARIPSSRRRTAATAAGHARRPATAADASGSTSLNLVP